MKRFKFLYFSNVINESPLYKFWFFKKIKGGGDAPVITVPALKFSSQGNQTLGINTTRLGTINPVFEYSTDGETWTSWTVSDTLPFGNGTDLYIRGMNEYLAKGGNNYTNFVFSTDSLVECSGNVMYLFDYTQDLTAFPDQNNTSRGIKYLFLGCTALKSAPDLPATTLVQYCYYQMFNGCTNLISAPKVLPATTLAQYCYNEMFSGCTALKSAPELPTTTLADSCYLRMFDGCTALISAPELPATTVANNCYQQMFRGCTSLQTPPRLPALSLKSWCYAGMFENCTSLNKISELPATSFSSTANYFDMFKGCSLIKMSATQTPEYPNEYTFGTFLQANNQTAGMFYNTGGTLFEPSNVQTIYTANEIVRAN